MNWRKTTVTALLGLVVILCLTGCPAKPPATPDAPWGPDSAWRAGIYACSVVTTAKGDVRYIMDWTNAIDTGTTSWRSGETATVTHVWNDTGHYDVRAKAILDANPAKASSFSSPKTVKVLPNEPPVVDSVQHPPVGVVDAEVPFTVFGHDPDGDSLRAIVKWSTSKDTTTGLQPSPCMFTVSHIFELVDTARVIVWTQDWKGALSKPDTVLLPVGKSGGVKWSWQNAEGGAMSTSALVANDGANWVVMSSCWDDLNFHALRASDKKVLHSATTRWPDDEFNGHPGLTFGHVIVGSSEGELNALTLGNLDQAWRWPNVTQSETLEPGWNWSAPAFNGANIYIGREDESLYKFVDNGASVTRVGTYAIQAAVVDAPVVAANGNVYFGTDSGYLVAVDPNLTLLWRTHLIPIGEVNSPIIGSDGTIYCGSDSTYLYAVSPDSGKVLWTLPLDGPGIRPALGRSALFVGTEAGTFYSINPVTHTIIWQRSLAPGVGFNTTPIVADSGLVYVQDQSDVLYCLHQADDTLVWSCDCPSYLKEGRSAGSHRPRTTGLFDYSPNPSITPTGNIIVVGDDALYCVAGYVGAPLDTAAAWPKWQKNLSNTGSRTTGR